jgi:hypothetical protein
VRPAKVDAFLRIVERDLSRACACVRGEDLLVAGILGPGKAHRALASRLGDFVLLAKEGYAFEATPSLLKTRFKAGNHGGLSRAEVLVPLYLVGGAD